jgi:hypothetical protein
MSSSLRSFFGLVVVEGGGCEGGGMRVVWDGEGLRSEAVVKNGLTGLVVLVPFTLTEVFFMVLSGIRGGSMAVGTGSQYAFEKGSMDLMLGSR